MATIKPDAATRQVKVCPVCDAEFSTAKPNQIACSQECAYLRKKFGGRAREAKAAVGTATCERCGAEYKRVHRRSRYCPAHTRKREKRTGQRVPYDREATERWRYGVTSRDLWEAQGGACGVCAAPIDLDKPRSAAIDHDHKCCPGTETCGACLRGLLCFTCNRMLGFIENPAFMQGAISYLHEYGSEVVPGAYRQA